MERKRILVYKHLFSPVKLGSVTAPNRICFEPMGNHFSETDGCVSEKDIAFYGARAAGGCGIIISETCSVNSKTGRANSRNICLDEDRQIPGMAKLAEAVHRHGSVFFPELYHPGRQGMAFLNGIRKKRILHSDKIHIFFRMIVIGQDSHLLPSANSPYIIYDR